jgi:hypothetical protein
MLEYQLIIYEYVYNLVVSVSIRSRGVFMNVWLLEHRALSNNIFLCGNVYYSSTIIITILTYSHYQTSIWKYPLPTISH